MPRPADKIFLRLATQQGALREEDADDIWEELLRLERVGEPSKARKLAVEFGFLDADLARRIKRKVREYLTEKVREETRQSRAQRRIAGYELLERLGSGAMGTVYKARHRKLDKLVALKLLNPSFAQDEKYVARFVLEAQAAARLNHPNVVAAYDVGQSGDVHYIAMEYVDGKTVKELIQRRGRLEESASIEIVLQILGALQHAHRSSLVHRDVKPANIMITGDGVAKLLDLGLARRTDVECGLTGEGKAIGTPYFMAPEQALDKGADYRADIYSLGATLFNMVTGDKPYKAGSPVAVMNMHISAPIPDAHELVPEVSAGLSRVIQKMLAKRPADRYQSHDALARDLEAVLSGFMPELDGGDAPVGVSTIRPRRPGAREGASRPQRSADTGSLRGLQVGALAAGVLLVLGAFVFARSPARPDPVGELPGEVVAGREGPRAEAPRADLPAAEAGDGRGDVRERAARQLLAELDPERSWRRVEQLEELVRSYPGTRAARDARLEATRLRGELAANEQQGFGEQAQRFDRLEEEGDLRGALEGYAALARQLADPTLRKKAEARANGLGRRLDERLATLLAEGKRLEDAHRSREAARVWRDYAALLPAARRAEWLRRAEQLEERARARVATARVEAGEARREEGVQEAKAAAALPGRLAELVRQGRVLEAYELATSAVSEFSAAEHKELARRHAVALRAILDVDSLAVEAFAARKGERVRLKRRKGGLLRGKLVNAADGKLSVSLAVGGASEAVIAVKIEDLAEEERWSAVRRMLGKNRGPYLRAKAALELYRGEAKAEETLAAAAEAGVDLAALAEDLRAASPAGPAGAGGEGPAIAMAPNRPQAGPRRPDAAEIERRRLKALQRNRFERWLIKHRLELFPEADVVGYADGQLEPRYTFQENQNFGKDWRRVRGRSRPVPPGTFERSGLILEGNGRAEFVAPLVGDLAIKVHFVAQMFDRKLGRFAITLDGEDRRRLSCELGRLVYWKGRKRLAIAGEDQGKALRSRTVTTLELLKTGRQVVARFNGVVSAEWELPEELGVYRLGLEWNRASLDLHWLRAMLSPEIRWVERKLGKVPGKS
ncbi:MAG: serine/threonine protein kinase [Planctomycetota bacterium]|nr:MAG: serine/threonine protein kinase [Planctomycetota bacterium]